MRVAGYTFLAVGALLLPLNSAAAYNFVLEEEGIAGDVVWLWASVYSFLFYLLLAVLGLGILYGFMSHAALSALSPPLLPSPACLRVGAAGVHRPWHRDPACRLVDASPPPRHV